jgi:hypothetical protein
VNQAHSGRLKSYNPNIFFPVILIGIGVILLLRNMGLLAIDPLPLLWRMWPLIFVVIGLDILLRWRGVSGMLISGIVGLVVVALFIALMLAAQANPAMLEFSGWTPALQQRTETVNYPLNAATTAEVNIDFNSGEGSVRASADSTALIQGELSGTNLVNRLTQNGDHPRVTIQSGGGLFVGILRRVQEYAHLRLNPLVLYDLRVTNQSGSSELDLSALSLRSLQVEISSGSSNLTLPRAGQYRGQIEVSSGSANVRIPTGVAVRLESDVSSGSLNVRNLTRVSGSERNGIYETPGFNQNGAYVLLRVQVRSGSLTIQ